MPILRFDKTHRFYCRRAISTGIIIPALIALCFFPTADACALSADGWVEASIYPPHNERTIPYNSGTGHSRYGLELYLELKHRKVFVFTQPFVGFGRTIPQADYTYRADPIAVNHRIGIGYKLLESLDIRLTHSEWISLNERIHEPLMWNAIQVRWSF